MISIRAEWLLNRQCRGCKGCKAATGSCGRLTSSPYEGQPGNYYPVGGHVTTTGGHKSMNHDLAATTNGSRDCISPESTWCVLRSRDTTITSVPCSIVYHHKHVSEPGNGAFKHGNRGPLIGQG